MGEGWELGEVGGRVSMRCKLGERQACHGKPRQAGQAGQGRRGPRDGEAKGWRDVGMERCSALHTEVVVDAVELILVKVGGGQLVELLEGRRVAPKLDRGEEGNDAGREQAEASREQAERVARTNTERERAARVDGATCEV